MSASDEHADVLGRSETSLPDASIASADPLVVVPGRQVTDPDVRFTATFVLNLFGLAGICAALAFAFAVQFGRGELPCPLCLLQRLAFVMVGVGLLLNLIVGDRPLHYAVAIAAAMGGCIPALRQIALHLQPGDPGFGSALFGLHFYTWAFIGFAMLVMFCALCLALMPASTLPPTSASTPADGALARRRASWWSLMARVVGYVFLVLTIANVVSTTLECGLGSCPDDPVQYRWWPHESLSDLL